MSPRAPKHCGRTGCTTLVTGRTYCDQHQPEPWSGGPNAWQGHGTTRRQRALVAEVLTEEPVCADCGMAPSTEAGHIIPRSQGGQYVRANLKGQCRPCNLAQMRRDRRVGDDTAGGDDTSVPDRRRQHPARQWKVEELPIGTIHVRP